jgi:hypothetical protein
VTARLLAVESDLNRERELYSATCVGLVDPAEPLQGLSRFMIAVPQCAPLGDLRHQLAELKDAVGRLEFIATVRIASLCLHSFYPPPNFALLFLPLFLSL